MEKNYYESNTLQLSYCNQLLSLTHCEEMEPERWLLFLAFKQGTRYSDIYGHS